MIRRIAIALIAVLGTAVCSRAAEQAQAAAATIAVTPADTAPAKAKENSIAVGVTLTDGNSDTLNGTASALHERKRDAYTWRLGADYAYAEDSNVRTTENGKAYTEYRHLVSERAYLFGNAVASFDDIADVDYRLVISAGPGYYLLKSQPQTLGVEVGPAYIREKVAGEVSDQAAVRFGERYDRQLSPTAKCWQAAEFLPVADDFNDYLINAEIGVEAAINTSASLRLVVKDAYDSTPAKDREENDVTVIGAIACLL